MKQSMPGAFPANNDNNGKLNQQFQFGSSSPTDTLKVSTAFTFAGFETVNDKVLREMNERAKNLVSQAKPSGSGSAAAAAAAAARASPRNTARGHKRFSSVHRRQFARMEPITSHYTAMHRANQAPAAEEPEEPEEVDHKDNGKRTGGDRINLFGSPTKRRKTQLADYAGTPTATPTKPAMPNLFATTVGHQDTIGRGVQRAKPSRQPALGVMREETAVPKPVLRSMPSFMRSTKSSVKADADIYVDSEAVKSSRLPHSSSTRSLRPVTKVEQLLNKLPDEAPGQTDVRTTEKMLSSLPSTKNLSKNLAGHMPVKQLRASPSMRSLSSNTPVVRTIRPSPSLRSISAGQTPSKIPRSQKSIGNLRAAAEASATPRRGSNPMTSAQPPAQPPATPGSRLLKSRSIAKSSPNLSALASRPAWR